MTILITAGRIEQAVAQDTLDVPKSTRLLEASGKWIIPDLIDSHVHFFNSGGLFTRPEVILRHIPGRSGHSKSGRRRRNR